MKTEQLAASMSLLWLGKLSFMHCRALKEMVAFVDDLARVCYDTCPPEIGEQQQEEVIRAARHASLTFILDMSHVFAEHATAHERALIEAGGKKHD